MYQDTFDNVAWFTIITPSAPRLFFSRSLKRNLTKAGASKALAGMAATTSLEILETSLWTLKDASPNATVNDRINMVKTVVPYSAGLGFLSAVIFR